MVLDDKRQHAQFAVGSDVEVSSDEEGFRGIWFPAKILSLPLKANKNKYLVEYKSLICDEKGSDPLKELVDPSFLRPPPPAEEGVEGCFQLNDVVEAFHFDGWWIGVVTEVLGEGSCRVFFQNPPDEVEFQRPSLRFHKDWVDGKWVRPEKKTMGELMFSPGTPVEVNLERGSPDVWYPGTVFKGIGKSYFMVEYTNSNEMKLQKVVVDYLHIRPSPPRCNNSAFQLLDKVDAFCNFGWSNGVITKVLGDGKYIVFFKRTKKEKELSHRDLRVPVEQINGKWIHSSQDAAVISNAQENSDTHLNCNGKISLPPENSGSANASAIELRTGQEEQGVHSGKAYVDSRAVSPVRIELATLDNSSYERSCEKLNEEALPGVQFPPQVFGTEATLPEEVKAQSPASLEILSSDVEDNASMGKSSSSGRKLEAQGDLLKYSKKRNPSSRRKGTAHRITLALASESRTPMLSAAVIDKLGKKNALECAVNDGIRVNTANDGDHEREDLTDEGTSLKRKRATPYGNLTVKGRTNLDKTEEALQIIDGTHGVANSDKPKEMIQIIDGEGALRRSTRERKTVYGSLKLSRKPMKRKMRMTTEILSSTQAEFEESRKRKAEALFRNRMAQNSEPVSNEDSGNISDDRTLSSQLGDSHSPPMVDGTQSEGRNHVLKETLEHNDLSTRLNDLDADENANQSEDDTGQGASEISFHPPTINLPFTKTSPIWKMIEAMEVFRRIPQNPHFQPLYEAKEDCREGLAIGCMVTYSGLVEKISKFHFSDTKSVLDDSLETLLDLGRQGFNVQPIRSRIEDLMSIKSRHEHSQTISEEVTSQIEERQRQRARIGEVINEIDKRITELTEKRALAVSQIEMQEYEIEELKSRIDCIKSGFEAAWTEFEKVATAPW